MKLRAVPFVIVLTLAILLAPLPADAQQAGKVWRVGLMLNTPPVAAMIGPDPQERTSRAFVHSLRDLGYVDGRNIIIERRSAEGQLDRIPSLIQDLVGLKVDVLVISGDIGTRAARQATDRIPIVGLFLRDPVASGLGATLARPGGNVTGVGTASDPGMGGKMLELLKDISPKISRVTVLRASSLSDDPLRPETKAAAQALKVTLTVVRVDRGEDYEKAFARITQDRPDALLVSGDSLNLLHRNKIIDFAANRKLPTLAYQPEFAESGGLMAYGTDQADPFRRAASYVDKILKGANPGDLPIEEVTKRALLINLKTAKALGITIPQTLLLRADRVIE
jgi:putative tryptophan/tyrosine transport system substrate-binding protein